MSVEQAHQEPETKDQIEQAVRDFAGYITDRKRMERNDRRVSVEKREDGRIGVTFTLPVGPGNPENWEPVTSVNQEIKRLLEKAFRNTDDLQDFKLGSDVVGSAIAQTNRPANTQSVLTFSVPDEFSSVACIKSALKSAIQDKVEDHFKVAITEAEKIAGGTEFLDRNTLTRVIKDALSNAGQERKGGVIGI